MIEESHLENENIKIEKRCRLFSNGYFYVNSVFPNVLNSPGHILAGNVQTFRIANVESKFSLALFNNE